MYGDDLGMRQDPEWRGVRLERMVLLPFSLLRVCVDLYANIDVYP